MDRRKTQIQLIALRKEMIEDTSKKKERTPRQSG